MANTYKKDLAPRRTKKKTKKKRGGTVLFLLFIAIAVFIILKIDDGSSLLDSKVAVPSDNIQTNFEVNLDELSALITDDMYTFTAEQSDIDGLYKVAEEYPEYGDKIKFFIKHIGAYSQMAVSTILMAPEKIDFILLEPFSNGDDGAYEAEISIKEGEVPFLIQYDSRWAFHTYGDSAMGNTACGPTSLSMVAIGLTGNTEYTPTYVSDFAMNNGYYVNGSGTAWSLFTDGATYFGLIGEAIPLDKDTMCNRLNNGEEIIASMMAGDFTRGGHLIVIHGYGSGGFEVYDPSSIERSEKTWSFDRLNSQIAQLWSFRKA